MRFLMFFCGMYRKIIPAIRSTAGFLIYAFYLGCITMLPIFVHNANYDMIFFVLPIIPIKLILTMLHPGIMSGDFEMRMIERMTYNGTMREEMTHNEYGKFLKEFKEEQERFPYKVAHAYASSWSNTLLATGVALIGYFPLFGNFEFMSEIAGYSFFGVGVVMTVFAVWLRIRARRLRVEFKAKFDKKKK